MSNKLEQLPTAYQEEKQALSLLDDRFDRFDESSAVSKDNFRELLPLIVASLPFLLGNGNLTELKPALLSDSSILYLMRDLFPFYCAVFLSSSFLALLESHDIPKEIGHTLFYSLGLEAGTAIALWAYASSNFFISATGQNISLVELLRHPEIVEAYNLAWGAYASTVLGAGGVVRAMTKPITYKLAFKLLGDAASLLRF